MAANYEAKYGNVYYFGDFEEDTPLEIEFDKPVKAIRCPVQFAILGGDPPAPIDGTSFEGEEIKFPNIGGYPIKMTLGGTAGANCMIVVNEFGDAANAHYFDEVVPPTP